MTPEQDYLAHLATGKFMLQRSRASGKVFFHPRLAEPGTGARDLEWTEVSGYGTVYARTVIRPRPPAEPYNVVLVDLDEGPRMMSRVDGVKPEDVSIGMRVKARIAQEGTLFLVVFDACEATGEVARHG